MGPLGTPSAYALAADAALVVTCAAPALHESGRYTPFILARRVLRQLADGASGAGIATLPGHAKTALSIVFDDDCTIAALLRLFERDPMLAGAVLQAASSARYATGAAGPVTLRDAVLRLGVLGMRPILLEAVGRAYLFRGPAARAVAAIFEHSLCVANVCAVLARFAPSAATTGPWQDERTRQAAFACGLFHDVGRVHVLAVAPSILPAASATVVAQACEIAHADVGAALAARWGLPPVVVEAVERHHGLFPDPTTGPALWHAGHLVGLAERLIRAWKQGTDGLPAGAPERWPAPWPTLIDEAEEAVRLHRALEVVLGPRVP